MPIINPKLATCYIANVGKGKTMIMTYNHALPALIAGCKVVSDYKLNWNGPNITYFTPEEFDELCMTWRNCILLIDEIGIILDSRQFKEEGSNTRRFFSYHRKHHVEIVTSTQHISQVAKTCKNIITDWQIVDQTYEGKFAKKLLAIFGFNGLVIKTEHVELEELTNEKEVLDPEAPIIFGQPEKAKTYWLSMKKLIRNDLQEFKDEKEYTGCEVCKTRFTDRDNKDTKDNKRCPLCMSETIGNVTAIMYDTDYELPSKKNEKKRIAFLREVTKWENYTPALSTDDIEHKKALEGIIAR